MISDVYSDTWTDPDTGYTWYYRVKNDAAEIYNGKAVAISPKPTGTMTIPTMLGGKPVTSIGTHAFYNCIDLTNVMIPDGVTSIANYAFLGCSGLTSISVAAGNSNYKSVNGLLLSKDNKKLIVGINGDVTIPDEVMSIGSYAFYNYNGLMSVTIPNSVTNIGAYAFSGSTLTSVAISPGKGLKVESFAFSCAHLGAVMTTDLAAWCEIDFDNSNPLSGAQLYTPDGLVKDELIIPNGVGKIGDYAFAGYNDFTNLIVSGSVTNIGISAFSGCYRLTGADIPDNVIHIGSSVFCGCTSLMHVTLPSNIVSIEDSTFYNCHNLASVTIPESVTNIGSSAFYYSGLTSVVIPSRVARIGGSAFQGASGLERVEISPAGELTVGGHAFFCSRLNFVVTTNLAKWCEIEFAVPEANPLTVAHKLYVSTGDSQLKLVQVLDVPEGVRKIGSYAFYGNSYLTSVMIPNSVTNIGQYSFSFCRGMSDVVMSYGVKNIERAAFSGCSGLTSVAIPDSVTAIGNGAFSDCSRLKWVVVPANVTTIGGYAFSCPSLQAVYLQSSTPPIIGDDIYRGTPTNLTTYVPNGSTGWLFPNLSTLPETWPMAGNDGRNIENGSPTLITVTFDANGGKFVGATQNATLLAGLDFGTLPGAVCQSYSFLGWWTERDGGERVTANTVVTASMGTLYAHWAEGMAFEMGGDADWSQETDGSWRSGAVDGSQTSWMTTTVFGEGEVSFKWKVSSYSYYAKLQFYIDGVENEAIGGEVGWTDKTFVVSGKGEHTLKWAYTKTSSYTSGSDCGWVDAVAWTPYVECQVMFDANGGDMGSAAVTRMVYKGQPIGDLPLPVKDGSMFLGWWTADGIRATAEMVVSGTLALSAKWERNPFVVGTGSNWIQDGDGSWKSGATAHDATNSISMSVSGTGTVAFDWRASCEGFYRTYRLDYLAFFIDGVEQAFINGETDWANGTFTAEGEGDHVLTWSYIKDSEGVSGLDCAWLRDVVWTPSGMATGLAAWLSERGLTEDAVVANGRTAAECYALGLDPMDATNDFRIVSIEMVDGKPQIEWVPKTNRWTGAELEVKLKGTATLEGPWGDVPAGGNPAYRFFKVEVVLP